MLYHVALTLREFFVLAHIALALVPQKTADSVAAYGQQHGIVAHAYTVPLVHLFRAVAFSRHVFTFERREHLGRHPAFKSRTSVGAYYDAYGHIKNAVERFRKEIGQRTELPGIGRLALFPCAAHTLLRLVAAAAVDSGHTHMRSAAAVSDSAAAALHRLREVSAQRHIHIALAGTQPHLAYENILQKYVGAVAAQPHGISFARSVRSGQCECPQAVGTGRGTHRRRTFSLP